VNNYVPNFRSVYLSFLCEVVSWAVAPCSVVVGKQRFGVPCCLHLQGWSVWPRGWIYWILAQQFRKPRISI